MRHPAVRAFGADFMTVLADPIRPITTISTATSIVPFCIGVIANMEQFIQIDQK